VLKSLLSTSDQFSIRLIPVTVRVLYYSLLVEEVVPSAHSMLICSDEGSSECAKFNGRRVSPRHTPFYEQHPQTHRRDMTRCKGRRRFLRFRRACRILQGSTVAPVCFPREDQRHDCLVCYAMVQFRTQVV
jgi:hypothetical protein